MIDSISLSGVPAPWLLILLGDVTQKGRLDLRPKLPGIIKVHPRYYLRNHEVLLQIDAASQIGKSGVLAISKRVFGENETVIRFLHLAADDFDHHVRFYHLTMTVNDTRSDRYERGTFYFGSRSSAFQVVVYDKLREQQALSRRERRQRRPTRVLSTLMQRARNSKCWTRIEARYKGPECPARTLRDQDALRDFNPFERARLRPFEVADPSLLTGNDFLLACGIHYLNSIRMPQEMVRKYYGRNFLRFMATHKDLFIPAPMPDLYALYRKSIDAWLQT
jgi:hypothetical protein